jgi:hypothetical protein
MKTAKKNKKQTQKFWTLFHQYRTKIALLTFFVVLPITLVLIAYLGPIQDSRSVTFDTDSNNQDIYISNFDSLEDLEDLDLNIKWTTLRNPIYRDDELITTGLYRFNVTYNILNGKNISNVRVQIALKPLYGTEQDNSSLTNVRSTSDGTNIDVTHNVLYPFSPLWFVTIKEPTVYLKIIYRETFAGNIEPIDVILYANYSLKDEFPPNVE